MSKCLAISLTICLSQGCRSKWLRPLLAVYATGRLRSCEQALLCRPQHYDRRGFHGWGIMSRCLYYLHPSSLRGAEVTDCGRYLLLTPSEGCDPVNRLFYVDLQTLEGGITGRPRDAIHDECYLSIFEKNTGIVLHIIRFKKSDINKWLTHN